MLQLTGLIPATPTPMHADGSVAAERIPALVDYLVTAGAAGLYVGGTTCEGRPLGNAFGPR